MLDGQLHQFVQLRMRTLVQVLAAPMTVQHQLSQSVQRSLFAVTFVLEVMDSCSLRVDMKCSIAENKGVQVGRVGVEAAFRQPIEGNFQ